jgi:hypothetical protein
VISGATIQNGGLVNGNAASYSVTMDAGSGTVITPTAQTPHFVRFVHAIAGWDATSGRFLETSSTDARHSAALFAALSVNHNPAP